MGGVDVVCRARLLQEASVAESQRVSPSEADYRPYTRRGVERRMTPSWIASLTHWTLLLLVVLLLMERPVNTRERKIGTTVGL